MAPAKLRPDDDTRFTFGLTVDVCQVLEDHGYPPARGLDFIEVQQALFALLYDRTDMGSRP